jgi:hypothetical protein
MFSIATIVLGKARAFGGRVWIFLAVVYGERGVGLVKQPNLRNRRAANSCLFAPLH